MNKLMKINCKTGQLAHRLTREIRKKFIGESANGRAYRSDFRVVLYSHDTMGIGHMRRNLLIANQIKRAFPRASVLVIAGAKEASIFSQNAGIDCLTLPAFHKKSDGTYTSRNLEISVDDVLDFRCRTILAAIQSFKPNLFVVDKVPAGAGGELIPTLEWLNQGSECRCVLGLRDVLDSPDNVERDWEGTHALDVIRQHFESIWIYGDRAVYDSVEEYQMPADIASRVTFTGYLNTESRLETLDQLPYQIDIPYVLCTVGGGQDGMLVSENFVEAIRITRRNSVLLTGPCMPTHDLHQIQEQAKSIPSLKVVEFVDEGDLLIRNASHVVSMGGYNTVSAILSHKRPAFIVPRIVPREEQLIRARRLAELGFVSMQRPEELTPNSIANWLIQTEQAHQQAARSIDMNGLECISETIQMQFPEITTHARGGSNQVGVQE